MSPYNLKTVSACLAGNYLISVNGVRTGRKAFRGSVSVPPLVPVPPPALLSPTYRDPSRSRSRSRCSVFASSCGLTEDIASLPTPRSCSRSRTPLRDDEANNESMKFEHQMIIESPTQSHVSQFGRCDTLPQDFEILEPCGTAPQESSQLLKRCSTAACDPALAQFAESPSLQHCGTLPVGRDRVDGTTPECDCDRFSEEEAERLANVAAASEPAQLARNGTVEMIAGMLARCGTAACDASLTALCRVGTGMPRCGTAACDLTLVSAECTTPCRKGALQVAAGDSTPAHLTPSFGQLVESVGRESTPERALNWRQQTFITRAATTLSLRLLIFDETERPQNQPPSKLRLPYQLCQKTGRVLGGQTLRDMKSAIVGNTDCRSIAVMVGEEEISIDENLLIADFVDLFFMGELHDLQPAWDYSKVNVNGVVANGNLLRVRIR